MRCPFCDEEMVKGKILGDRYALEWMPEDQKLFLGIWARNSITLGSHRTAFGRPYTEAFVCNKCGKLIADL